MNGASLRDWRYRRGGAVAGRQVKRVSRDPREAETARTRSEAARRAPCRKARLTKPVSSAGPQPRRAASDLAIMKSHNTGVAPSAIEQDQRRHGETGIHPCEVCFRRCSRASARRRRARPDMNEHQTRAGLVAIDGVSKPSHLSRNQSSEITASAMKGRARHVIQDRPCKADYLRLCLVSVHPSFPRFPMRHCVRSGFAHSAIDSAI